MTDILKYGTESEKNSTKKQKAHFIESIREGDVINDVFAVKVKSAPRPYKRGTWFGIVVSDRTGEISVKFWGGDNKDRVKRLYDSFKIGDVIEIRLGNVELYDGKLQISVNEKNGGLRRCSDEEFNASDFIFSLTGDERMHLFESIRSEIQAIKQPNLRMLLETFFKDEEFVKDYMLSPSAITNHHNYVGGNIQHAVGVLRLCKNICEYYPNIDVDMVVTGAILHDVGKLKEYRYSSAIDKTDEGNLIGHIVLGEHWIREVIEGLRKNGSDFPTELEYHLCHIILSHHGRYEFGSPRMPKTIEACVLHQADLMDSQVKNYLQSIDDAKRMTDDSWTFLYDPDVGRRRPFYLGEKR